MGSGDHGPFNSWDRQPYLTTVNDGTPSMQMAWREIHHNFLIDNYSPQEAVDNDDGSAYYHTHHNFMVYGGRTMKSDFGGHDNIHFNNVYAHVGAGMQTSRTLVGHEDKFFNNKVVLTGNGTGDHWRPQCDGNVTQLHDNAFFSPDGQFFECGGSLSEAQAQGFDQNSTVTRLPSADPILKWGMDLLNIHQQILID